VWNTAGVLGCPYVNIIAGRLEVWSLGASTDGEVDATCVQFGSRGGRIPPQGGRIPPDIWVILMIAL